MQLKEDGSVIPGAPFGAASPGEEVRGARQLEGDQLRAAHLRLKRDFATPWLSPDPNARFELWPLIRMRNGMVSRQGTSFLSPEPIPDLIGMQERRYLDRTGLEQHRSPVEFMRYAALNTNGAAFQMLGSYAGFVPGGVDFQTLPDPKTLVRYSDAQLYALTLFVYSLKPPANANPRNELTHPRYDILPVMVGTDPYLAMNTRRGTGYYKVPSLRGLWYRGPFTHDGSVARLEDWFDAARLREDYVPTGWKGPGATSAVKGHEFGLRLSAAEEKALIAFLMTL